MIRETSFTNGERPEYLEGTTGARVEADLWYQGALQPIQSVILCACDLLDMPDLKLK